MVDDNVIDHMYADEEQREQDELLRKKLGDNNGQLDEKVKRLESEIKRLQKEKLFLQILDMERQNATMLHEKLCTRNHIDECEWFHEIKDGVVNWEDSVHKNWLQKAQRLIHAGYHVSDVVAIKDIMGSL